MKAKIIRLNPTLINNKLEEVLDPRTSSDLIPTYVVFNINGEVLKKFDTYSDAKEYMKSIYE